MWSRRQTLRDSRPRISFFNPEWRIGKAQLRSLRNACGPTPKPYACPVPAGSSALGGTLAGRWFPHFRRPAIILVSLLRPLHRLQGFGPSHAIGHLDFVPTGGTGCPGVLLRRGIKRLTLAFAELSPRPKETEAPPLNVWTTPWIRRCDCWR